MNNPELAGQAKTFFKDAVALSEKQTTEERQSVLREIMQRKVDRYNAQPGDLDKADGYNCKLCMNRGNTAFLLERNGMLYDTHPQCRCMEIRRSIHRLKQSGLESAIRECTFERFIVETEWQQKMVDTAKAYLAEGISKGEWLFIGGAVGSGKTHICTAVARELLYRMPVYYMTWPAESTRLKSIVNDEEAYGDAMQRVKTIDVLYIDDFFKPIMGRDGVQPPTTADVRIAYEIINHRYVNHMPTIISSERYPSELLEIDEATSSRIAERSRRFTVALKRDRSKNRRIVQDALI